MIRLDKFLADCGCGTRSDLKKAIRGQAVKVNGVVCRAADTKIDENKDQVTYKGELVCYEKNVYYLLHKPAGCITSTEQGPTPTVMQYLPEKAGKGVAPVGRLDLDTEGLLLLTNDGKLAHHLLSPAHHVDKVYYALLDGPVPESAVAAFAEGVDIGDEKLTLPAELKILPVCADESGNICYGAELKIHEGRFHQVKRMFEAVGRKVIYLKRLSMGPLELGDLEIGACRKLTPEEIEILTEYERK